MLTINEIHSEALSKLNNLIHNTDNITIKIPQIANPAITTDCPFKALVSGIELKDLSNNPTLTIDTLICKLNISDLRIKNLPINNYKKNFIVYKNNTYTVVKEGYDAFENMIILYLNKKG